MLVTRDHTTTNLTLLVATESEGKSIILVTGDSTTTNTTLLQGLSNSASYWLLGTQLYYNKISQCYRVWGTKHHTGYTGSLPDLITLGFHNIPFSDSAWNFGFILDSKMSMKKHLCQTAYFELKCISSIRRFLTEDAAKTQTRYILYPLTAWLLQLSPHGYT